MRGIKRLLRSLIDRIETPFQRAFGARGNPFAQLGALGWFFFWIVAASGVYLYAFCDTGVTRAYQSVEALTHSQWWAGGVLRSLHRYASDALVVIMLVHMTREFAYDRLRGVRWFAWITGLILVPFIYACGVTGYWMVWDRLAQYVAQTTTEWLDALPIFAEPLTRNFLDNAHLSGRFFTLMAFLHIATPLLLLLTMWIHIQRHSEARVNPSRELAAATFAMLLVLSLLRPALSQPPADPAGPQTPGVRNLRATRVTSVADGTTRAGRSMITNNFRSYRMNNLLSKKYFRNNAFERPLIGCVDCLL